MRRTAIVLLAALGCACGSTQGDEVSAVIGPEGGTLAVTDSRSALYGMQVVVPPGALPLSATVTLRPSADGAGLPTLPTGIAAFAPVAELLTTVPFERDVRLSFPIRTTTLREDQVLSGFRVDDASASWRVVFAAAVEGDTFSIDTRAPGTWRWGLTLLETVEYQTLKPAMEAIRGVEALAQAEADARREFDSHLAKLQETGDWTQCDTLGLIARIIVETRNASAQSIEQTLLTACGGCSVTTEVFLEQLVDYARAKVRQGLVDLIIDACNLNFLLELYLKLEAAIYFHNVLERLSCDYECLVKTPPPGLWGQVATWGACNIALVVVAIGADYTDCHPDTGQ
jgi:hypothetical protein